jgi:hypothetical protein
MKDEFDFDPKDLDFDDELDFEGQFDEQLDEQFDEEIFDLRIEEVFTRTAILTKNNMFALLCLKTASQGGAICRVDPRERQPAVQLYDDPEKAHEWFTKSLRTSCKNGWKIVYDGLPLKG